jgi:hypothetical protein
MNETRETATADTQQAIPGLTGDIASGGVKKNKKDHAAAGESGRHRVKHPVYTLTA